MSNVAKARQRQVQLHLDCYHATGLRQRLCTERKLEMEERECDSNCDLWQVLQPRPVDTLYDTLPEPTESLRSQAEVAKELYRPIPIKGWQTRVIRLQPEEPDAPLVCDLLVADIILFEGLALHESLEVVAFDALSYVGVNQSSTCQYFATVLPILSRGTCSTR